MGKKKSNRSSPKKLKTIPISNKKEKQPHLNNLMKILRPKVYITDTCNFKSLVQQLTGNGKYAAAEAPPPPLSPPAWAVPLNNENHQENNLFYQESMSCGDVFAASVEASPELGLRAAASSLNHREMEIYKGFEAMLMMEMDSGSCDYDVACDYDNEMMFQQQLMQDHQQQVCVYDYDLSNFV